MGTKPRARATTTRRAKGGVGASKPKARRNVIEPIAGLTVVYDERKLFKAKLVLTAAKVDATVLISKPTGYDATLHNQTLAYLVEHQLAILKALRQRGHQDYLANRSYILQDWDIEDAAAQLPAVRSVAQIDRAIRFTEPEINLLPGFGNIAIRCENTWDQEHQYTVVLTEFAISDSDCLGAGVRYPR